MINTDVTEDDNIFKEETVVNVPIMHQHCCHDDYWLMLTLMQTNQSDYIGWDGTLNLRYHSEL